MVLVLLIGAPSVAPIVFRLYQKPRPQTVKTVIRQKSDQTSAEILYTQKKYNKNNYVVVSSKAWDQNMVSLIHL